MNPRAVACLLLVLLASPLAGAPPAAASADASVWWDAAWHFRIPVTLATTGTDATTGAPVDLAGARDPLVLVPLDLTAALSPAPGDDAGWPFDRAGRPLSWTLDPASVRVVPVDAAGAPIGDPLPARFLPFHLAVDASRTDRAFDASVNARGTLAVVLPGVLDAPHRVHVYFDTVENGAKPAQALAPRDRARLDALLGPGPAPTFHAFVPPVRDGELSLVIASATGRDTRVTVHREVPGAVAEVLATDARVTAAGITRIPLPHAEGGYPLRVMATRPVIALLETAHARAPAAASFHAALDGGSAGSSFLVPGRAAGEGARTLHVVGTTGRTSVHVEDAASGAPLDAFSVSARAIASTTVPEGVLARVQASAPVLVTDVGAADATGSAFLAQGVTLAGASTGAFLVAPRAAGHVAVTDTAATMTAFPLDAPSNALTGRVGDPPRYAWATRERSSESAVPWAFAADGQDIAVMTGARGFTPLAGTDAARAWRVPLAPDSRDDQPRDVTAALVAPFAGTGVTVRHLGLDGAPGASASVTLGRPGALTAFPDGSGPFARADTVLDVATTRPAFVFAFAPGAPANAALPGIPPVIDAEVGRIAFHGALLAWSEPVRDVTARPGERVAVTLTLANHGRALDGAPLVEDVTLALERADATGCGAAVDGALTAATFPAFAAPGEREVRVLLTVPADAADGACARFTLTARSSTVDGAAARADVVVRARAGFEPELRVLDGDGNPAPSRSITVPSGTEADVLVRLRNVGGSAGTARVAFAPAPGYVATLAHAGNGSVVADEDGRSVTALHVDANATMLLRFRARPASTTEPPWDFRIEVASTEDALLRDGVTVTVVPQPEATLQARAEAPRVLVPPGGNATTRVTLAHDGEALDVRVRAATDLPDGWRVTTEPARLLLSADADGARRVNVTVHAPPGARVGDAVPVTVAFEPTLAPQAATRVTLTARVVNDHAARVTALVPAVTAAPGESGEVAVRVESHAAAASRVRVAGVAAPAGWALAPPAAATRVAPGDAVDVRVPFTVDAGAPALRAPLVLVLEFTDDASPAVRVNVTVNASTRSAPVLVLEDVPARVALAPGVTREVSFTVRNVGNAPATLDLSAIVETFAWQVEYMPPDALALAPNGTRVLRVNVTAPDALDADQAPVLRLNVNAEGAPAAATRDVPIRPLVRDLALTAARANGDFVEVDVANRGTERVPVVRVVLRDGERVLATFDRAGLAPGAAVTHVLPAPASLADVRVHVDGGDGVEDAKPEDNVRVLREAPPQGTRSPAAPLAAARDAPGVAGAAVLALAALAALATRRRVS